MIKMSHETWESDERKKVWSMSPVGGSNFGNEISSGKMLFISIIVHKHSESRHTLSL